MRERIKKFCILSVKMEGFKRFKEPYEVNLSRLSYISGGNGQGKSTIADAIAYAFCGTPFWGEKSCDRLQNSECKEIKVEVRFVDENGEVHTLIRRRNGSNTTITMDTLQLRQTDLATQFAEKDIFLSVLNPLYFIERVADSGREFLQKLLPPVKQEDVLALLSENTRSLLENESLLDPEFYAKKKREELKEIDETATYFEGQIDALKTQQREATEKVDAVLQRGQSIVDRKTALEEKQFAGIDIEALKSEQAKIATSLSNDRRASLHEKLAEAKSRQYVSKFAAEIQKVNAEIESLKALCSKLAAQAKGIKVGDKCPTCFSVVTESNYREIIATLKKQYDETVVKGQSAVSAQKELLELDKKSQDKFEEFKAEDIKKYEAELASLGTADVSEIAMIEDKIKYGNLTEEEFAELISLIKQADDYAKEVELLCETDKIPEKIAAIEKSVAANDARRIEVKNLLHAVGEFAAKKAEITLNQLKMNRASIKLYDVAKTTGEIKDVFVFTYDGKDYRWLSTSEKIKAGLEVSELLARLTCLEYPTYIDNAECITTKLSPVRGQVILAYARGTELAVHNPQLQNVQMKEAA